MANDTDGQRRTIPQLNALIRALVEQEMLDHPFWIGGIVTRHFLSDFGHIYFDLNDDDYFISCILREKLRGTLDFTITNGIEIEVFGTVRVFEKRAQVQIEVEKAQLIERPSYVIDATVQEQLAQKGLWPKPKRPLPTSIRNISLITSKQSDARHDFYDMYQGENGHASVKLVDVRLQGQQAAREIAEAINQVNQQKSADVIAIVRGGGRAADLAVFNDIVIAEAIGRSAIPIVTGIGHQQDNTLADQVADMSLITPTAAASHLARITLPRSEIPKSTGIRWEYVIGMAIVFAAVLIVVALFSRPL
jgi:exodeoxyribonuclease VII large subunit